MQLMHDQTMARVITGRLKMGSDQSRRCGETTAFPIDPSVRLWSSCGQDHHTSLIQITLKTTQFNVTQWVPLCKLCDTTPTPRRSAKYGVTE